MDKKIQLRPSLLQFGRIIQKHNNFSLESKPLNAILLSLYDLSSHPDIILLPNSSDDDNAVTTLIPKYLVCKFIYLVKVNKKINNMVLQELALSLEKRLPEQIPLYNVMNQFYTSLTRKENYLISTTLASFRNNEKRLKNLRMQGDLYLRPTAGSKALGFANEEYINCMIAKHPDLDIPGILEEVTDTIPSEYALDSVGINELFVSQSSASDRDGISGNIKEQSSYKDIYASIANNLKEVFSGNFSFSAVKTYQDIYITADELSQLSQNLSILEQDWVTTSLIVVGKDDDSHLEPDLISTGTLATQGRHEVNFSSLSLEIIDELIDLEQNKKLKKPMQLVANSGKIYTLQEYRGVLSVLSKLWQGVAEMANKYPRITAVAIGGVQAVGDYISSELGIDLSFVIDFIGSGPTKIAAKFPKKYVEISRELCLKVIPIISDFISISDDKNDYGVPSYSSKVEDYIHDKIKGVKPTSYNKVVKIVRI